MSGCPLADKTLKSLMAANAQELKYVFAKLSLWLKGVFTSSSRFWPSVEVAALLPPPLSLSPSFPPRSFISWIRSACTLSSAHAHRPLSLPTQVPNTWLRRIRTRDRELRLAQKVTGGERRHGVAHATYTHEVDAWRSGRWRKSHFTL